MNNFIKQVIEEKFASKAQQRYFYAQASKGGKKGKNFKKMASEFSKKTDFDKIPEKVEKDVDEIVDKHGNIARSKKPTDLNTKTIGADEPKTGDEIVHMSHGQMGIHGIGGTHTSLRYWAESDLSKTLGADETILKDKDYDEAKEYFEKDLEIDPIEADERLGQLGYDKKLPEDKLRLVENPKKFMEEYIESILNKKTTDENDIVSNKDNEEEKKIDPIILKQLRSLKNSMDSHDLSMETIVKYLSDVEVNLKK
jgi:tetratricopeptide (TPR) repeat protein